MPNHRVGTHDPAASYERKLGAIRSMLQQIGIRPVERLSKRQELAMYARKALKAELASTDLIIEILGERRRGWKPRLHFYSAQSKRRLRLCLELIDILSIQKP